MASALTDHPIPATNGHLPVRPSRQAQIDETRRRAGPMRTMVAAAAIISGRKIQRTTHESWQAEAWDTYDQVGELRFVANAVAGAMSHARLFVGRIGTSDANDPEEIEAGTPVDIFRLLGGDPTGRAELLRRLAIQLFVPGDGWVIGLPPGLLDDTVPDDDPADAIGPDDGLRLADLTWHVFSVTEVTFRSGEVVLNLGGNEKRAVSEDRCYPIRVWRPHPRRWWTADSPVRANLPVLRELIGLTKHIGASIDSRLAGAGLLILPESATLMGGIAESPDEDDDPDVDPFLAALMDAMITPIQDRDSAAAIVPLIAKVSDEAAANIGQDNLIRFSTPFDERSKELRDEAIRRLALGLDTTPEMLLGMGSVNHWSAWLLDEINAKIHIDPVLSLICDALTTGYLQPALAEAGVPDADQYVVWWDLSGLTLRPDRSGEAQALHAVGALSDDALRRANGFDDTDAPVQPDRAVEIVLKMMTAQPGPVLENPALIDQMITIVREAIRAGGGDDAPQAALPADGPAEAQPPDDATNGAPGGTPDTQGEIPDAGLPASASRRPTLPRDE